MQNLGPQYGNKPEKPLDLHHSKRSFRSASKLLWGFSEKGKASTAHEVTCDEWDLGLEHNMFYSAYSLSIRGRLSVTTAETECTSSGPRLKGQLRFRTLTISSCWSRHAFFLDFFVPNGNGVSDLILVPPVAETQTRDKPFITIFCINVLQNYEEIFGVS